MAVKNVIKKIIVSLIPKSIEYQILDNAKQPDNDYLNISYSQEGEDSILNRIFEAQPEGFFVDIGAHHPFRFSNTYAFYKRGWQGINIDPNPNSKKQFDLFRPRDINIEFGVSETKGSLKYYNFFEKALNTFSGERAEEYQKANWPIESVINIETFPLADILNNHLTRGQKIDFMTIDVEGLEMQVLISNNWDLYKPKVILIEMLNLPFEELIECDIYKLLFKQGYRYVAKTINTVFFKLV
jgi:FkbM family methyltransferase